MGRDSQFQFQFQFQLMMAPQSPERPIRAPSCLSAFSQRLPSKQCQFDVCLVEHRSFPTQEDGISAASFLHFSFLQAINAVMLWPVRVQKVPQASEHLCPAKLQIRCDICCACQSSSFSFPLTQACSRDSHRSSTMEICYT